MLELNDDRLVFTFPEVHPDAKLTINFQRTLRIPDDGNDYPLPPGLGRFPLRHVDDHTQTVPPAWVDRGGVMLPMYQSEALWLNFSSDYISRHRSNYPFAVKVAAGKINAITGDDWTDWLQRDPQDYMVAPEQPWLDGFCVEKGLIRQFVAEPLGAGFSVEEQLTGKAEHGGLQIIVYPMKREIFERRFPKMPDSIVPDVLFSEETINDFQYNISEIQECLEVKFDMGLAAGGRVRQEICQDPFDMNDWEMDNRNRCFVHLANSLVWRSVTGEESPTTPMTAKEYEKYGLPWFEYYDDSAAALDATEKLKQIKSVIQLAREKSGLPLKEDEIAEVARIVKLRRDLKKNEVRNGTF